MAPTVAVCQGKDCRRRHEQEWADLVGRIGRAGGDVVTVPCLSVCRGPVVVVNGEVYERLRSGKARRDLARVVTGRDPSERLVRRRLPHGSRRTKALRRAMGGTARQARRPTRRETARTTQGDPARPR